MTHPEKVHAFIRQWPGLKECAYHNPATLALYSPQITIPGFDDGFVGIFDELNSPEKIRVCDAFRYSRPDTKNDKEPLCGDFIAWRHPVYGNYTASELSYQFVTAHDGLYSRELFNGFECLVWLLSHDSNWMPERLQEILKQGFKDRVSWWITDLSDPSGVIANALWGRPRNSFAYTNNLKTELIDQCDHALHELELDEDPKKIAAHITERGFLEAYFEERERIQEARKSRK